MKGIAAVEVAVVDDDLLWRVEHMNAVHQRNAREYGTFLDAIEGLTAGSQAVIVVGPRNVDEALDDLERIRNDHPEWDVLFVCDPASRAASAGLAAGAASVLDPEVGEEAIADAVQALLPKLEDALEGKVTIPTRATPRALVVVTSSKGGEGVTTVAANLAAALASGGARHVALVEADPDFGDLSLLLGVPNPSRRNRARFTIDADTVSRISVDHKAGGFRVVFPPPDGGGSGEFTQSLIDALVALEPWADAVVVDAPLEMVLATDLVPIAAAVLLVSTVRTTSLKNAMLVVKALPSTPTLRMVVNDAGRHHDEPSAVEVEHAVGVAVTSVLPYDPKLDRAAAATKPHVLADSHSRYARAVEELAAKVLSSVRSSR